MAGSERQNTCWKIYQRFHRLLGRSSTNGAPVEVICPIVEPSLLELLNVSGQQGLEPPHNFHVPFLGFDGLFAGNKSVFFPNVSPKSFSLLILNLPRIFLAGTGGPMVRHIEPE